jgi:hypothetical protein
MCFKAPKAPAVAPAPTRADVQGDVTAQRLKLKDQQGATGNIFTSALGDTGYAANAQKLAKLGAAA